MLEWYWDIKKLTEVSGAERNAFVHGRQESFDATKEEELSDDLDYDEADEVPYSAEHSALEVPLEKVNKRPEGGRFPSDMNVNRGITDARSVLSGDTSNSVIGAAGALPGDYGRPRSDSQSSTWSYDEKVCVCTRNNILNESADDCSILPKTPWKPKPTNSCLLELKFLLQLNVVCLSDMIIPKMKPWPEAKVPRPVVGVLPLVNQLRAMGSILSPDNPIRGWGLPRGVSLTLTGATLSQLTRTSRAARLPRENPHLASPPLVTGSTLSPGFTNTLLNTDITRGS